MQNTASTKPLNLKSQRNWPAVYFRKKFEKYFDETQNVKKLMFEVNWVELRPRLCLL